LKEILKGKTDEQIMELLPDTLYEIYTSCGLPVLLSLLDNLPKVPIYLSPKSVDISVLRPGVPRKKALAMLPENARHIYKRCGRNVLLALLDQMRGLELYVAPGALKTAQTLYIRQHHNGHNVHDLALRLGVSTCQIYKILSAPVAKPVAATPSYTPRLPF